MSDADAYYQSLLQQGYDVNQASVYTKEHFADFVAPGASPVALATPAAPAAPAAAAPAAIDPMAAMMLMNQQNQQSQQMMMQQQAMLAQSQQNQGGGGTTVIHVGDAHQQGSGKSTSTGYLLWLCIFLGLAGIHRFYYGRIVSGIIYLFTFGLLGFGQLYDLLIMSELAKTA